MASRRNRARSRPRMAANIERGCIGGRSGGPENELDRLRVLAPALRLAAQLTLAECGEPIVPCAAIVLGNAPVVRHPAAVLEPDERGIDRALTDVERVAGHLLDAKRDPPAMHGLEGERLEHEQVERP